MKFRNILTHKNKIRRYSVHKHRFSYQESFIPNKEHCDCGCNLMRTKEKDYHRIFYCNCCETSLFKRI